MRLAFKLSEKQRLFLIVRGPAPSCNVAGVIPVRGRKGANKVDFAGRANGRNLRPGRYLLSLSPVRRPYGDAPTTLVEVVSKRRSVPAKPGARKPTCSDAQALAGVPAFRFLRGEGTAAERTVQQPTQRPTQERDGLASGRPANNAQQNDVLGVAVPGPGFDSGPAEDTFQALIMIGILAVLGAILLTTAALVARFLRGNWNP